MPLSVQQLEKRETGCKSPILMNVVLGRALSLNIELDGKHVDTRGAGLRVYAYNASK